MAKEIEYKGEKAKIIMMGTKKKVSHFRGEVYVAVIQYGDKDKLKYDVVPDSTDPSDVDDLPAIQTFAERSKAISHFMNLESNKDRWK